MSFDLPKIDNRKAFDIVQELQTLLSKTVPELQPGEEPSQALLNIVGRFCEITIDRLNKAPEKNFLAFLDLLGVSNRPAQPARVPVTFYPSAENIGFAIVPAGTQVAAPPAKGESDPVIFETERELLVVPAKLESLVLRDADRDRYIEYDSIVPQLPPSTATAVASSVAPSTAKRVKLLPHTLYVGFDLYPHWPAGNQMDLEFVLERGSEAKLDRRTLQWEICTEGPGEEGNATLLSPIADGTEGLSKSGHVVFKDLPEFEEVVFNGVRNRWLRCRLMTPITRNPAGVDGMVRSAHLPTVKTLTLRTEFERQGLSVDQAFSNGLKLDLTKDFFPFGEKPKFGDTLYLASEEIFSNPDATVTCEITLTNPAGAAADLPIPPVVPRNTKLRWEFWDGKEWADLGIAELKKGETRSSRITIIDRPQSVPGQARLFDTTQAMSVSGTVSFSFTRPPAALEIHGQKSYWIRVRIVSGDYGEEVRYEPDFEKGGYAVKPATYAPPSIHSISLRYTVNKNANPKALLLNNDFVWKRVSPDVAFAPFIPAETGIAPILFFGFTLPAVPPALPTPAGEQQPVGPVRFPSRSMSVFVSLAELQGSNADSYDALNVLAWEYWNGAAWIKWTVRDGTMGIRRSGLIRVLAPPDLALRREFGRERYWFRMLQKEGGFEPNLRSVILNTTMALQGITIPNEILGASNGQPLQKFRTTHAPVLESQLLEVREPTLPSYEEQLRIREEEGDAAIHFPDEVSDKGSEVWVRWHEVANFYSSSPRDRHYLLNRSNGEVTFGDGTHGLIPSVLPGNIRMTQYRTGGGETGNKPAFSVTQLKTAVPYIDKLTNWEPAAGGSDQESNEALLRRGPRGIRHGGRAVTVEDFQDLAMLASPEVALAKCVPLVDLKADPDSRHRIPGTVSVIVVPRSTSPKPLPSNELLDRVRSFLDASRPAAVASVASTGKLVLAYPEYVTIDIQLEIAVEDSDIASDVELGAKLALDRFLHPLTGGTAGTGWHFGRLPHRSDVFGLIERIPGVSHVRQLRVQTRVDREGADKTPHFLICCGRHEVTVTLEE